ncbi:hypothetical protein BHE74_00044357 [Ensete ventricosum]|nr:hypothetical protein BHE74_00044357 [Ensete ventricosum]
MTAATGVIDSCGYDRGVAATKRSTEEGEKLLQQCADANGHDANYYFALAIASPIGDATISTMISSSIVIGIDSS